MLVLFAAGLQEAKAAVAEKDASITESLRRARREKDAFDRDLKAAKAETLRFRQMVESKADMDNNFKVPLACVWWCRVVG